MLPRLLERVIGVFFVKFVVPILSHAGDASWMAGG
jgi:hypothetical protein